MVIKKKMLVNKFQTKAKQRNFSLRHRTVERNDSKLSKMVDQDTQINFEQVVNENELGYLYDDN